MSTPTQPVVPAASTNLSALLNLLLNGSTQTALALLTGNPAMVIQYGSQLVGGLLHIIENHGMPITPDDLTRWKADAAARAQALGGSLKA